MLGSNVAQHLEIGETEAVAVLPAAKVGVDFYDAQLRVMPDTEHVHFFDPETGTRLPLGEREQQ